MKIRMDAGEARAALTFVARALPARPDPPALAGLHLAAQADTLTVTAHDTQVAHQARIDAEVLTAGSVVLAGRLLAAIARTWPRRGGGVVELAAEDAQATLASGATGYTLPTLVLADYPVPPAADEVVGCCDAAVLAGALAQVALAASRDETLPALTGVRVEIDGEQVRLAATDRYRLAVRELPWKPTKVGVSAAALIPARAVVEVARSLTGDAAVAVALAGSGSAGQGAIAFQAGGRRITTALLDGEFADYRSLLPSGHTTRVEVEAAALAAAIKRVALVAVDRYTPLQLSCAPGEVTVTCQATTTHPRACEPVPAQLTGKPISIAFNPRYVLDALAAIGSDIACLDCTTPTAPAVITGKTGDGQIPDYRYALMPIRP